MTRQQIGFEDQLRAFLEVVIEEARTNSNFRQRLQETLVRSIPSTDVQTRRSGPRRRNPPALDPFEVYGEGEDQLRDTLTAMDIEQLKDIVAGYGLDRARLALKWRKTERLIDLIVDTVKNRTHKGDAFRS